MLFLYVFVFIKLFDYSLIITLLILFFSVKKVSTTAHWYFVISLGCICDTFTFAKAKVWDLSIPLRSSRDDVLGAFLCIALWRELFRFLYNFNLFRKFIFNWRLALKRRIFLLRHLERSREISYFCFSKSKCIADTS